MRRVNSLLKILEKYYQHQLLNTGIPVEITVGMLDQDNTAAVYLPSAAQTATHNMIPMACMYQAYGYVSDKGLYIDSGHNVYETPSPSRHSSDGSTITDCCQSSPDAMYMYHSKTAYQLNKYWHEKVLTNRMSVQHSVEEVASIVHNILKQVELEEPRFACTLNKSASNRYDGFIVESPIEFHILLYLNHMAVFNYVDEGNVPGCAALKLSDGRKRSMSLWVEFITASGYLSARKIRAKFLSLIAQVLEKNKYSGIRLVDTANDVILIIKETYKVHISPAFSWKDTWPRSVGNWVLERQLPWPTPQLASEAMLNGITLVSKESVYMKDKQTSSEGDAWQILYTDAEEKLIYSYGSGRKRVLSIIKCLRDRHLDIRGGASITNYHLQTLIFYESEKHPCDSDWDECLYGERIRSVLLELIACLQSRQCQHYLQPNVDLFRGADKHAMTLTARAAWSLVRMLIINEFAYDQL